MFNLIIKSRDRFIGIIRDIKNYIFIWNTIKKNRDTEKWNKFKLRHDYIGRIYTIVNLRAEDFGEADEMVKELRYREKAEPMYEYMMELNLHEIVSPTVEYLPGTYSYLVKFTPHFIWLRLGWFIGFLFKCALTVGVFYIIGSIFNLEYFWKLVVDFLYNNKVLR